MFRSATIAVVDAAAIAYRISMQDGRTRRRRRGEAAASFALCFTLRRNNRVRTVRRFTRHAADELSELQEASLKNSGFPGRLPKTFSAPALTRRPRRRRGSTDDGRDAADCKNGAGTGRPRLPGKIGGAGRALRRDGAAPARRYHYPLRLFIIEETN